MRQGRNSWRILRLILSPPRPVGERAGERCPASFHWICLIFFGLLASPSWAGEVAISLKPAESSADPPTFVVRGLTGEELASLASAKLSASAWNKIFAVYVRSHSKSKLPPLFGRYSVEPRRKALVFSPRFVLQPGVTYRAVFRPGELAGNPRPQTDPLERVFAIPARKSKRTAEITHVFPTRNVLPENQLKFYIHFSAPMSRGEAYAKIRLLRQSGEEVELPFLELEQELWDATGKRFTLFFDPGRIKRGLKPREEVGPALEEGKSYTLMIDRSWRDAHGQALKQTYRKQFRVAAPDDTQPDPKSWKLAAPSAATKQALVVTFTEPLDRAMLERLRVMNADRREVAGQISVARQETQWQFQPQEPWSAGQYRLLVRTTLEDLAGNSIGRPFEVDVFRTVEKKIADPTISLPFVVR